MALEHDISGSDPYFQKRFDFYVFMADQVMEFDEAVFAENLEVYTMQGDLKQTFAYGTDYTFKPSDVDCSGMSEALLHEPMFNKQLIKSLTFIRPFVHVKFPVYVSAQTFYKDRAWNGCSQDNRKIDLTENLIADMTEQIDILFAKMQQVKDTTSLGEGTFVALGVDITGKLAENKIEDELHLVNTLQSRSVILPKMGSFYSDGLVVKRVDSAGNETVLTEGTDYRVSEVNHEKTGKCKSPKGVWEEIYILMDFDGKIKITYHAYGGAVTVGDIAKLYQRLNDLYLYLKDNKFLTDKTLGATRLVQEFLERLKSVEDTMRRLLINGNATGGDHIARISKIYTLDGSAAPGAVNFWTFASLYKVAGSNDVINRDVGLFRIRGVTTGIDVIVAIGVNRDNVADPITVERILDNSDVETDFTTFIGDKLDTRPMLQFRAIWDGDRDSGILIQIGMKTHFNTETIAIESLSGKQCCFLMRPEQQNAISVENTGVELPDAGVVWSAGVGRCKSAVRMFPYKRGHAGFIGCYPIEENVTKRIPFFGKGVDLESLERVELVVRDRLGNVSYHKPDTRVRKGNILDTKISIDAEDGVIAHLVASETWLSQNFMTLRTQSGAYSRKNKLYDIVGVVFYYD